MTPDPSHTSYPECELFPSGRRFLTPRLRYNHYKSSFFVPLAMKLLNSTMTVWMLSVCLCCYAAAHVCSKHFVPSSGQVKEFRSDHYINVVDVEIPDEVVYYLLCVAMVVNSVPRKGLCLTVVRTVVLHLLFLIWIKNKWQNEFQYGSCWLVLGWLMAVFRYCF